MTDLRFHGSAWCNVEVALRAVDFHYKLVLQEHKLPIVQAYILWALLKQDGQRASDLAASVGRVPTSFTPIIDSLEHRNFIKRKLSQSDRRSVLIHLTTEGKQVAEQVLSAIQKADETIRLRISSQEMDTFLSVISTLQMATLEKGEIAKTART